MQVQNVIDDEFRFEMWVFHTLMTTQDANCQIMPAMRIAQ